MPLRNHGSAKTAKRKTIIHKLKTTTAEGHERKNLVSRPLALCNDHRAHYLKYCDACIGVHLCEGAFKKYRCDTQIKQSGGGADAVNTVA